MKKLLILFLMLIALPVYSASTLYEYYEGRLPSVQARALAYDHLFDSPYVGAFEQNEYLLSYLQEEEPTLGYAPTTGYSERLSKSISAIITTISVTSVDDSDGIELPCSATNKCYFTMEAGTSKEERIMCTGVSGSTFTPCVRGLVATGISETGNPALATTHNAGSRIIMTNISQFFGNFVDITTAQSVAGVKTLTSSPIVPTPTTSFQATNKTYVDNLIASGVATSTETLFGGGTLSTQAQMAAGYYDITDPRFLYSRYASSTPTVATTTIPITGIDGKLHQDFLDLTEDVSLTGDLTVASTTFTASTTWDILPEYTSDPIGDNEAARKSYVDAFSANKKLGTSATQVDTHSSNAETTLFTATLPGGELSTNNAVDIKIPFSDLDMNVDSVVFTLRLKYGATTIATAAITTSGTGFANAAGYIEATLVANASTSAQRGTIKIFGAEDQQDVSGLNTDSITLYATGTSTEDSTGDLTLTVTSQDGSSDAGFGIVTDGYIASIIK